MNNSEKFIGTLLITFITLYLIYITFQIFFNQKPGYPNNYYKGVDITSTGDLVEKRIDSISDSFKSNYCLNDSFLLIDDQCCLIDYKALALYFDEYKKRVGEFAAKRMLETAKKAGMETDADINILYLIWMSEDFIPKDSLKAILDTVCIRLELPKKSIES